MISYRSLCSFTIASRLLCTFEYDIQCEFCALFRIAFKFLCSSENCYFMKSLCTPRIYGHIGGNTSCIFIVIYQPFTGFFSSYQWNTIYIRETVISAVKYKLVFKTFICILCSSNTRASIVYFF